jgi:lipid II:glycine glycyltransferase (peptidoglycan interpeptide bridge formation enzyme)
MAELQVTNITDKQAWEVFLNEHLEANFLQSWNWGVFHQNLGHAIERRGYIRGKKLVGVALVIVEPARRGRHVVLPAGPILDWSDGELVQFWLSDMNQVARQHACVFVRIRPQLHETEENLRLFKRLGFKKAPMHLHAELTNQIDLTKSQEELKSAMRKGTKYEVNRVAKLGIKTEVVADDRYINEFYDLQLQTARRHGFVPFSKKFLNEQFNAFAADGQVLMYRSTHEGQLLAMAFIIFYGAEAAYHYGASTELARKLPGAYAIQWQAFEEARRRGCTRYNLWGVAEHGQSKHRFYGVSVFKRGFGGEDVRYVPAHDLVVDKLRYPLTFAFETARRKARRL